MKINDYYLKELNSLRVEGSEFAKKNPGLSSYLAKEGQDPDVERLLEGFAFLTGRIRQQLDEELPEISHNLVQLLWPNYVRPIPSYAIVKFDALKDDVVNKVIEKESHLLSKAQKDKDACRFKTTFETTVLPLDLRETDYYLHGQKSILELDFTMSTVGHLGEIDFMPLNIFLSGSKFMAYELFLYFDRFIEKIELVLEDKEKKALHTMTIKKDAITTIPFNSNETMTPYPRNVFDGYVVLQEFFCYQDKQLFMKLDGLEIMRTLSEELLQMSKGFRLKVHFSKPLQTSLRPSLDDFSLYCTPVINLFETDAVPIRKSLTEDEYIVLPSELHKDRSEVFSIENVRGWLPSKNAYQDYLPFETFSHEDEESEYYSSRVKLSSNSDRTNTYIRFAASKGMFENIEHHNATVSVQLLTTNKDTPSTLQLGDISMLDPLANVNNIGFKNITIPSISYPPPIDGDFLWKVISNMSLNYLSLEDISTLKSVLMTYDFFGAYDAKQAEKTKMMLSGLLDISYEQSTMIFEGYPIRGIETNLKVDPSKFTGMGEAYLFCTVLNDFFALYCNINSFHRLVVHMENQECFEFEPKMGYHTLV